MVMFKFISFISKKLQRLALFLIVKVWSFIESFMFVAGLVGCIFLPVIWPMKFVCAILWLFLFYITSWFIGALENYRKLRPRK